MDGLIVCTKPLDVKSVDILYKPTNTANCYVIKTINRGVDSEWDLFTPNSIDTVVQKLVLETLNTLGIIKLLLFKSVLLKTMPVFGSAGFIFMLTGSPVCKPIPLMDNGFFTFFWLRADIMIF